MAKKEMKLEYVKSVNGALGAVAHFKNAEGKTYQIAMYTNPDMKVLKAKVQLKAEFPEYVAAWLSANPGFMVTEPKKQFTLIQ